MLFLLHSCSSSQPPPRGHTLWPHPVWPRLPQHGWAHIGVPLPGAGHEDLCCSGAVCLLSKGLHVAYHPCKCVSDALLFRWHRWHKFMALVFDFVSILLLLQWFAQQLSSPAVWWVEYSTVAFKCLWAISWLPVQRPKSIDLVAAAHRTSCWTWQL